MEKLLPWCVPLSLVCFVLVPPAPRARAEAPPKVVRDSWDAAYLEGAKVGWFHTRVTETQKDGDKVLATSVSMELSIRRFNSVVKMRMDQESEETAGGKVVALGLTQYLDKGDKRTERAQVR